MNETKPARVNSR